MTRWIALALLPMAATAHAQTDAGQCGFDHISDAEKSGLVHGYMDAQRTGGKARADAWAQQQAATFRQRAIDRGECPASQAAAPTTPDSPGAREKPADKAASRSADANGQKCTHMEMRNVNVPNLFGNGMSFALLQVCAD